MQFPPKVMSYKMITQYHSWDTDGDKIHRSYSDFPNFTHTHLWHVCELYSIVWIYHILFIHLLVIVYNFITHVGSTVKIWKSSTNTRILVWLMLL